MQVNHDALFSATTDLSTLTYLGVLLCKMTTAQVEALAAKPNRKDTKGAVPYMVLRAAIAKKLAEGDWKTAFAAGTLQVETPAEKAAKAANAQAEAQAKAANAQAGAEASGPWQQAEAEEAEATGSTGPQAESKASTESKGKGRPRNILTGAYHVHGVEQRQVPRIEGERALRRPHRGVGAEHVLGHQRVVEVGPEEGDEEHHLGGDEHHHPVAQADAH